MRIEGPETEIYAVKHSPQKAVRGTPSIMHTEHDIIEKALKGHKEEYRHLVSRHKDLVYSMIMRQVGNENIAEELSQETFVKAFLNLKSFRFESTFSTWITRIALNHTNSYFSSRRFKESLKTDEFNLEKHDKSTDVEQSENEHKERVHSFRLALSALKPKLREVIVLCGLEGKSYEEAATILQIPIGTIRSRLNKARLVLKENIKALSLTGDTDEN